MDVRRRANAVCVLESRDAGNEDGGGEEHRLRRRIRQTAFYSFVLVLALLPPRPCATVYNVFTFPFLSTPRLLFLSYPPTSTLRHATPTRPPRPQAPPPARAALHSQAHEKEKRARQHITLRSRRPKRVHRRRQRHAPAYHNAPRKVLLLELERRRVLFQLQRVGGCRARHGRCRRRYARRRVDLRHLAHEGGAPERRGVFGDILCERVSDRTCERNYQERSE